MFGPIDAVFFFGYMLVVLIIGFAVARREQSTIDDYFRAGNRLPWYAIGASIIAAGISSEQFVGEVGYAYKLGMPVMNWEWMVFPSLSILLFIFIPIYVRNRIITMPEYLERRYGSSARTIYAVLTIASYIFANFALVFYTGGYALETMWGFNRIAGIWLLAIVTGAYTVYGGMLSVAWTDFFQCLLLMGGGLYVFFAGMNRLHWDLTALLAGGQRAHLVAPIDHEVPWTALVILGLSTSVWYYASDQFINQRCLGARNEWHAKMGVLFAIGLQLLLPLATAAPGMIYYAINPSLTDHNAAYPRVVAELVPAGMRGLVVAAILGAIMSTISGLVNSTSTMVTLDLFRRWKGQGWSERRLVALGRWAGAAALVVGALFAPVVMKWQSIFRYCQDIWAPMAAPAVVVFVCGALWRPAKERGAIACLLLAILTVPFTFLKSFLADANIHIVGPNLENSLIFAGGVYLVSIALMICLSLARSVTVGLLSSGIPVVAALWLAEASPAAVALLVVGSYVCVLGWNRLDARSQEAACVPFMWNRTMMRLPEGEQQPWFKSIWFWWLVGLVAFGWVYIKFW